MIHINLLQFSSFFYQFSNLPSTSLSSLATHTWEDDEGTEHSTKMFVIVNWWKIGHHLEVPSFFILNFLQTFTCPKMVSEIILWSQPFSPLPHTIPLPSIILHYLYDNHDMRAVVNEIAITCSLRNGRLSQTWVSCADRSLTPQFAKFRNIIFKMAPRNMRFTNWS